MGAAGPGRGARPAPRSVNDISRGQLLSTESKYLEQSANSPHASLQPPTAWRKRVQQREENGHNLSHLGAPAMRAPWSPDRQVALHPPAASPPPAAPAPTDSVQQAGGLSLLPGPPAGGIRGSGESGVEADEVPGGSP